MKMVYVIYQQLQYSVRGITQNFETFKQVLRRSIREIDEDGGHMELIYQDHFGNKNTINDNPSYQRMAKLIREKHLQRAKIKLQIVNSSQQEPQLIKQIQIPLDVYLQPKSQESSDSQISQPSLSQDEDQPQPPKVQEDDSQASDEVSSDSGESEKSKKEILKAKNQAVQSEEQSGDEQNSEESSEAAQSVAGQIIKSEEEKEEQQQQDSQQSEQQQSGQSQGQEQGKKEKQQADKKEKQQAKPQIMHAQNNDSQEEQSEQEDQQSQEQSKSSQNQSQQSSQQTPPPSFEEQAVQATQPKHQTNRQQQEKIQIAQQVKDRKVNKSQQLQFLLQQSGKQQTKGVVYSLQDKEEQIQHHHQSLLRHPYSPSLNEKVNQSIQNILQEIRGLKQKVASLQQASMHRHELNYTICNGCGLSCSKGARKKVRGVNLCIFFCVDCDSKYDIILKNNQ